MKSWHKKLFQENFVSGQGVVLDRCAYSDFVFLEAMAQSNYISKGGKYAGM
jgi:hypothetical protein